VVLGVPVRRAEHVPAPAQQGNRDGRGGQRAWRAGAASSGGWARLLALRRNGAHRHSKPSRPTFLLQPKQRLRLACAGFSSAGGGCSSPGGAGAAGASSAMGDAGWAAGASMGAASTGAASTGAVSAALAACGELSAGLGAGGAASWALESGCWARKHLEQSPWVAGFLRGRGGDLGERIGGRARRATLGSRNTRPRAHPQKPQPAPHSWGSVLCFCSQPNSGSMV
jgi:hypothetical protein